MFAVKEKEMRVGDQPESAVHVFGGCTKEHVDAASNDQLAAPQKD